MNPNVLGGILKNFYMNLDINNFKDRLKIQKIVYLLKAKDLNLGYDFNLYLYGPYSPDLTRDAFQVFEICNFEKLVTIVPSEKIQEFEAFVSQLIKNNRANDLEWLEIVSSYLFIKTNLGLTEYNDIVSRIKNKRNNFSITDAKICDIISEIKSERYFSNV